MRTRCRRRCCLTTTRRSKRSRTVRSFRTTTWSEITRRSRCLPRIREFPYSRACYGAGTGFFRKGISGRFRSENGRAVFRNSQTAFLNFFSMYSDADSAEPIRADYSDSYSLDVRLRCGIASETVGIRFLRYPRWVNGLMKIRNALVAPFGLKTENPVFSGKRSSKNRSGKRYCPMTINI